VLYNPTAQAKGVLPAGSRLPQELPGTAMVQNRSPRRWPIVFPPGPTPGRVADGAVLRFA